MRLVSCISERPETSTAKRPCGAVCDNICSSGQENREVTKADATSGNLKMRRTFCSVGSRCHRAIHPKRKPHCSQHSNVNTRDGFPLPISNHKRTCLNKVAAGICNRPLAATSSFFNPTTDLCRQHLADTTHLATDVRLGDLRIAPRHVRIRMAQNLGDNVDRHSVFNRQRGKRMARHMEQNLQSSRRQTSDDKT